MGDIAKKSVGAEEAALLDAIHDLDSPGVHLEDARRLLPRRSPKAVHYTLKRLARKNLLRRLAPGKYYLPDVDPARAACHAWAPAYESFLTVLAQAGATEQIPRRLDLAYAQARTRRARWGDLPVTWHPVPPEAFQGYAARPDGVLMATPAKAAADLVHRHAAFGGITPYRAIVETGLRVGTRRELEEALQAYASRPGTLRRLLHLAYGDELPPAWRRRIGDLDLHNPVALDLTAPRGAKDEGRGPLNIVDPEASS